MPFHVQLAYDQRGIPLGTPFVANLPTAAYELVNPVAGLCVAIIPTEAIPAEVADSKTNTYQVMAGHPVCVGMDAPTLEAWYAWLDQTYPPHAELFRPTPVA